MRLAQYSTDEHYFVTCHLVRPLEVVLPSCVTARPAPPPRGERPPITSSRGGEVLTWRLAALLALQCRQAIVDGSALYIVD